jgi:hypothetical protein
MKGRLRGRPRDAASRPEWLKGAEAMTPVMHELADVMTKWLHQLHAAAPHKTATECIDFLDGWLAEEIAMRREALPG